MWDAYRTDSKGKVRPITKCSRCGRVSVYDVCSRCREQTTEKPSEPAQLALEI